MVVDPHAEQVISVENNQGETLGQSTPLDVLANSHRQRHKPSPQADCSRTQPQGPNLVEMAYRQYHAIDDKRASPVNPTMKTEDEES